MQTKRIVCVSSARKDLDILTEMIPKEKISRIYTKDTEKEDLSDVNDIWSKCNIIAYTSTIQTGVSYMGDPFDICYANLKTSNLARDAMQMLMRCRHLKDNTVKF